MPKEIRLRWDDGNREHATRHGVSLDEVNDLVAFGVWRLFGNTQKRSDQRRLIGVSPRGRLITVILEQTGTPAEYRPITSRPATEREASLYYERTRQRRA